MQWLSYLLTRFLGLLKRQNVYSRLSYTDSLLSPSRCYFSHRFIGIMKVVEPYKNEAFIGCINFSLYIYVMYQKSIRTNRRLVQLCCTRSRSTSGTAITCTKSRSTSGTAITCTKSRSTSGTALSCTRSRSTFGIAFSCTKSRSTSGTA